MGAIPAKDLMTGRVLMLSIDAKLIDAVGLMVNHGFRHVPITSGNTVVGFITALSVISDIDRTGVQLLGGHVKDASLITNFIRAGPNDDVNDIVRDMVGGKADVSLVFEGDKVVGIITERDVIHKMPIKYFSGRRVFDIMSRNPVTIGPDSSVGDAIRTMATHGVRHLLITRGDRVMGVVSVRDVLRYLMRYTEPGRGFDPGLSVNSIMSHNPITIDPSASVIDAVNLMRRNNVSSLPVVERGRLVGIVTERDLIREVVIQ